jgi:hypothetical protein
MDDAPLEAGDLVTPVAKRKGTLMVILGGLATSFLALLGVWLIASASEDFNLMGWYIMFVIPAGALMVGIVAGSGYCLVSWVRGVKITGVLLWSILALQVLAYFEAQYLEYRTFQPVFPDGTPVGFGTYFDVITRSMSFQARGDRGPGQPLGMWGYAFRLLEIAGFAVGGIIPSLMLRTKPFCEHCQIYMKTKSQGWLPAGVVPRKVSKKDTQAQQAYEQELKSAFENGMALLQSLSAHATAIDAASFRQRLAELQPNRKEIQKQNARIEVQLNYCPSCSDGHLRAVCHTGQGEQVAQQELFRQPVDPQFVRDALA